MDDPAVVLNAAARYLEARSRSVAEVRRHLASAGYASALVDGAIARLLELGYLDDTAFAGSWVASRDRARPRGERALRVELARKGVADETIRTILADRAAEHASDGAGVLEDGPRSADDAAAERLLARKAAAIGRAGDPRTRRRKAYALLARNGFDPDVAARVSERVARAGEDEPAPD